jgi:hypothetical protein
MSAPHETDWLGSRPCFYHERTGAVSTCIHDVIDYRNLEIDPDGLIDYLDFGYCAFGHTPVRHVRFLPPCTRLATDATGRLTEVPLADPVDVWQGRRSQPAEAIERLQAAVGRWERQQQEREIVLPLSGGHDSRLLALLVGDKSRVRSFSYGISRRQAESREVIRAQRVAARLGLAWEQIELGDFHGRMAEWDRLFGVSTHAHGMYHLEFFAEIARRLGGGRPLLSGIVGDAWAGHIPRFPARTREDLPTLGLARGLRAEGAACRLRGDGRYRETFWISHQERLRDPVFQIVEVIRMKMPLLSFILRVPEHLGFSPWSPYLEPEVALTMITLPAEQRRHRRWQHEFFAAHQLDLPRFAGGSFENNLDLYALQRQPPDPLDVTLLRELFAEEYLERINRQTFSPGFGIRTWALAQGHPLGARSAAWLRAPNPHLSAYAAYLTLKPLENLLRRRDRA